MSMIEIWRDIKDYEGLYQVSNLGRVRRFRKWKGHTKKEYWFYPKTNYCKGYLGIHLSKNHKTKRYVLSRLVAMTFPDLVGWTEDAKGKPFEELQVNHKDEFNKANNCVDNLEWCTCKENINYGTRTARMQITQGKPVLQYTMDMVFVAEYPSAAIAGSILKISYQNICNCCKGRRKSAGGYIWKYKD